MVNLRSRGARIKSYLHCRYPISWLYPSQKDIARNLTDDISDGPTCLHIVELIAVHAQVFLPVICQFKARLMQLKGNEVIHSRDECVVDVYLVQVLDEIAYQMG